jgi:hypothetical protein
MYHSGVWISATIKSDTNCSQVRFYLCKDKINKVQQIDSYVFVDGERIFGDDLYKIGNPSEYVFTSWGSFHIKGKPVTLVKNQEQTIVPEEDVTRFADNKMVVYQGDLYCLNWDKDKKNNVPIYYYSKKLSSNQCFKTICGGYIVQSEQKLYFITEFTITEMKSERPHIIGHFNLF